MAERRRKDVQRPFTSLFAAQEKINRQSSRSSRSTAATIPSVLSPGDMVDGSTRGSIAETAEGALSGRSSAVSVYGRVLTDLALSQPNLTEDVKWESEREMKPLFDPTMTPSTQLGTYATSGALSATHYKLVTAVESSPTAEVSSPLPLLLPTTTAHLCPLAGYERTAPRLLRRNQTTVGESCPFAGTFSPSLRPPFPRADPSGENLLQSKARHDLALLLYCREQRSLGPTPSREEQALFEGEWAIPTAVMLAGGAGGGMAERDLGALLSTSLCGRTDQSRSQATALVLSFSRSNLTLSNCFLSTLSAPFVLYPFPNILTSTDLSSDRTSMPLPTLRRRKLVGFLPFEQSRALPSSRQSFFQQYVSE